MNCFITGSAGYIGSSLAKRLVQLNHNVTGLIHQSASNNPIPQIQYIKGDITNKDSFSSMID
ncbi:MAG: NAD-dependent epimerase/dehydratase family protein, partial [Candidatus Thermoplasmatota archaeon]|nr:NAD-dependent epimerase/dehydratase family protein [Candidatus Thermoplasmatota archaeon]